MINRNNIWYQWIYGRQTVIYSINQMTKRVKGILCKMLGKMLWILFKGQMRGWPVINVVYDR